MPSELITTARGITSPEVFVLVTKIYPDKHLVLHGGLHSYYRSLAFWV